MSHWKLIHLILQGLDINKQNSRQSRTVSPYPLPVANPKVFPAVFLHQLPRWVIQVAIVLLRIPKKISSGHDGFEDKVF